jgi:hypothetical protein
VNTVRRGQPDSLSWRKSSWSAYNGNCVEVALIGDDCVVVRDTKDEGTGSVLAFGRGPWREFVKDIKLDGLDPAT